MRFLLVALLAILTSGCSAFLYYPSRVRYVDPEKLKFKPQEVRFKRTQNEELVAWHFRASEKPSSVTFLFFHGNGQNLSAHFASLYWILEHGYDFLIFDYPGYGISDGEPTPDNTVEVGRLALAKLRELAPQSRKVIFGQSLGGAVAMRTLIEETAREDICLAVVDSTFASYKRAAKDLLAKSVWTWGIQWMPFLLLSDAKAPRADVAQVSPIPLIVIHGSKDDIVRIERGRQLFAMAQQPKEFWEEPNGAHITAFVGPNRSLFRKRLLAALQTHCGPVAREKSP